jgi:type IV pilus assembly protein PilA
LLRNIAYFRLFLREISALKDLTPWHRDCNSGCGLSHFQPTGGIGKLKEAHMIAVFNKSRSPKTTPARLTAGFSLIELLIVVAIIGIIAAIAIPNLLASKRAANEGSAQATMRTLTGAEATFQATKGVGNFGDLGELSAEGLVDIVLAQGQKSGYAFEVLETDMDSTAPSPASYVSTASTLVASGITATGTRNFFSNETGVITWGAASTTAMDANSTSQPIGQ